MEYQSNDDSSVAKALDLKIETSSSTSADKIDSFNNNANVKEQKEQKENEDITTNQCIR